jgi:hypothetical protein
MAADYHCPACDISFCRTGSYCSCLGGKAPGWFNEAVAGFYPRFAVEKHRFDVAFFISKADQVIFRFCLLQLGLIGFTAVYTYWLPFRCRIQTCWNIHVPVRQVYWLKVLFYLILFFFTYDWLYYINLVRPAAVFYQPLPF